MQLLHEYSPIGLLHFEEKEAGVSQRSDTPRTDVGN